jgi:hypothetical protein
MRTWFAKWWPTIKILLAAVILIAIGRRFWQDLQNPELLERSLGLGWLALSGTLYVVGLALSALFWYRLLHVFGQQPTVANTVRAYYLGHLGKYVPGKAVALFLRAMLAAGPGVRSGVAGLTAFYEVITTMASGALVAVVVLALFAPDSAAPFEWETLWRLLRLEALESGVLDRKLLVLLGVVLLCPLLLPILPGFFNRVAGMIAKRVRDADAPPLARVPISALLEGLATTAICWLIWGISLWTIFQAICERPPEWDWALWLRWSGLLAIAYVAGFVILLVPGGLGVREFFLTLFLIPEIGHLNTGESEPRSVVILAVLLLRVVWTAAELVVAAIVWWLPTPQPCIEV